MSRPTHQPTVAFDKERLRALLKAKLKLVLEDGIPSSNGNELRYNCTACVDRGEPTADSKRRLYLHIGNDSKFGCYLCFRCGLEGRLLTAFIDVKLNKPKTNGEVVTLPKDFVEVTKSMHAYSYLLSRGIPEEDIRYYRLGVSGGRIVFPDYDSRGKLIYWVSRDYSGRSNVRHKYLNAPVKRSDKVYNLERFKSEGFRTLIITEGPISSIVAGRDSVATYGKLVGEEQIEKILGLDLDEVYIALDPDAKKESLALAKALSESVKVRLVQMPDGEDPASLGREKFRGLLDKAIEYDQNNFYAITKFILGHTEG